MCFPGKRQKNLLADDQEKKAPATPTATTTKPASAPAAKNGSVPVVQATIPSSKMAPRVAIVIYSMYGHIAKCM